MSSLVEMDSFSGQLAEPGAGMRRARGVEVDSFSGQLTESAAEPAGNRRQTNVLHQAWRSRWLILLCMLVGGGVGWAWFRQVTPRYTSISRIYVDRVMPQLITPESQLGRSTSYLYTQAELIRSTSVLAAAAEAPEVASLKSFQNVENRVGAMRECLRVNVGIQDEIINVSAELPDPEDASNVVNAVVAAYVTKYAEDRRSNTKEVLDVLTMEYQERDKELRACRKALDDFRRMHPSLAVKVDNESVITRSFTTVSDKLNETEIALLEAKTRYNRVRAMYDKPSERMYLLEAASENQPMMRDANLEEQVEIVERSLTSERAQWGEGHPRVRLLRESLDEVRGKVQKQQQAIIVAYVDRLRQEYEVLEHKHKELRNAYDAQFKEATDASNQALQLASLQEAQDRTAQYCDVLEERIKELNLSEDATTMNVVDILEVAAPSNTPTYPVRSRFLATGLLAGALLGFGLAWLRDFLDHRLRSVEEIASVLQLPVLGALPYFGDKASKSRAGQLVALAPRSTSAEAVRTLRTALHFGLAGRDVKAVLVTSPSPGDGKSTVASNLALALAQADQRVLLLDADLRKPSQHKIFELSRDIGLSSILTDRRPIEEAIVPNVLGLLDVLPAGPSPTNPVELLNNGFFAELLDKLRERYDRIIIDSPPVMPIADARVIAAISDSTLLVLRAERTTRRMGVGARDELWRVRASRIGVVVNGVPLRKLGPYGYGYGGEYGYGSYGYVSYGYGEDAEDDHRERKALPTDQFADVVSSIEETT
jgi:capsular exopolysaccharide synthesis family protein